MDIIRSRGLLVAAAVGACASPPGRFEVSAPAHAQYQLGAEVTQFEVSNGLRVLLLRDRHATSVEVDLRVQVGSRDDPPGKEGLAHLVEHLLYETRAGGPGKPTLWTRLRARTLTVNAETSYDFTHFIAQARPANLEELLAIEATRLAVGCHGLDAAVFEREREVVRNELRSVGARTDVPLGALAEALYPAGHPYAHMPGGTPQGLAAITLADVCRFVADHHTPDRSMLVVAGDIDPTRLNAALAPLAQVPRGHAAPRAAVPPIVAAPRSLVLEADIDEPILIAAWPTPPVYGDAGERAALAAYLLLDGAGGHAQLGGVEAPYTAVAVRSARDRIAADRERLVEARAWAALGVVPRAFEALRSRFKLELLGDLESLGGRAMRFADWMQFRGPDGADLAAALRRVDDTQRAVILAEGQALFDRDKITWIEIRPRAAGTVAAARSGASASIDFTPDGGHELSVDEAEAQQPLEMPDGAAGDGGARRFSLPNGLEALIVPMPSDIPMVTARLVIRAGTADEPPGQDGVAMLAAALVDSEAAEEHLEAHGLDLGRDVSSDRTTFELHGLGVQLAPMVATLGSLLTEGEIWMAVNRPGDRGYRGLKRSERIRNELSSSRYRAARLAQSATLALLYGDEHPLARPGWFTRESFDRLDRSDVEAFRKQHHVARKATLIIAGAIDPDEAEALVRKYLARIPAGEAPPELPPPPSRGGALAVVDRARGVVSVRLGWAVAADDRLLAARLVAAEILERRMQVVRERLAASYGASAMLAQHAGAGAYLVGAEVDPARAAEAVKAMRRAAVEVASGASLGGDFVRARRAVLARLLAGATSSHERARQLDWLAGRPPELAAEVARGVARLTLPELVPVLAADLAADRERLVATGARPELEALFAGIGGAKPRYLELR